MNFPQGYDRFVWTGWPGFQGIEGLRSATVRKVGRSWVLYTKDGSKVLGRHTSREGALAQERAIYASKARYAGEGAGHPFHGNQWTGGLSAPQVDALQNYAAGGELNEVLRRGGEVSNFDKKEDTVGNLDRAIDAQLPLREGAIVYRSVSNDVGEQLGEQSMFTDKGFVSTSKSLEGLEAIAEEAGADLDELTVLRIVSDGSVKGLDVNQNLPPKRNFFSHQQEIILARGSIFTVVGRHTVQGRRVLNVRVSR